MTEMAYMVLVAGIVLLLYSSHRAAIKVWEEEVKALQTRNDELQDALLREREVYVAPKMNPTGGTVSYMDDKKMIELNKKA